MFCKTLSVGVMIALSLGAAGAAMAQSGVEVETTAPAPPKFEIIRPEAKGSEITRPRDADIYRGDPVINYDPAFIEPFTKETATGRMGLAGWGSPVGVVTQDATSNMRQPGWLSFGFGITWGGPERKPAVVPAATPR
jgi:hypothetical protein